MTCLKLSPNLRKVSKPADDKQKVEDLEVRLLPVYAVLKDCTDYVTLWIHASVVLKTGAMHLAYDLDR